MKKSYISFLLGLLIICITKVNALEGDLIQSLDITDNGNGTKTITGLVASHKSDNTDYTFYACNSAGVCQRLDRYDTETRTGMNEEVTAGETYNYDNVGVNQTIPSSYNTIVIKDKNGKIVSQGEMIDKHSTNAGIKIIGTQCDLRNATGNRSGLGLNSDLSGFETGANYNIVSIKENVMTDKGDIATMYCVGVSNKPKTVNGYNVYSPGVDATRCVFDSCGTLINSSSSLNPPKEDDGGGECSNGYGSLGRCSNTMDGSINTCGGIVNGTCTGSYTTANVFSPPSSLNGCTLIEDSECKSATCGYSQSAVLNLTVNLDNSKTYLAGTYFKNPSLISTISVLNIITSGTCPSWKYLCNKNGKFESEAECEDRYGEYGGCSCRVNYTRELIGYFDKNGNQCTPSGTGLFGSNSGIVGGNSDCKAQYDTTMDGYMCSYKFETSFTPNCDAVGRCNEEMSAQGLFSYSSVGKTFGEGTVKFETDSNNTNSESKYELHFQGTNIQNKAYVFKKNGKVFYNLDNVNTNDYNVYDNVHFVPLDFPTKSYYVDIISSNLMADTGTSSFRINLNTNKKCTVDVVNKFYPSYNPNDKNNPICEKEPCGYGFIYRPINLNVPFPNSYLTGCVGEGCRQIGDNWYTWINNVDNQKSLAAAYSKLEYSVYLNNELMSKIRTYNKKMVNDSNGYLDLSINVDGSSQFFKSNEVGICNLVNGNDNNATLCSKNPGYFGLGIAEKWGR